ncbi:hypothetical protein [Kaistella pullorum]|uniref:Uncharacterized protein n=1 Tax=Kaistella pullorum TaxID=2763074 RepID=A0ABR8WJ06_9FLAO|nr:hypothetical protein [Kaistella pullorum]MBD8017000.1 hypothetical protein [Kaistella pullorum]
MQINKWPTVKKVGLLLLNLFYDLYIPVIALVTRFIPYIRHRRKSNVIAKPGTLSFAGGLYNPGALKLDQQNIILLAKSQKIPWFNAVRANSKYYLQGSPVVFILNTNSLESAQSVVIKNVITHIDADDFAIEDLRLFRWGDKIMINHTLISKLHEGQTVHLKSVSSAISVLSLSENSVTILAVPQVDFPRRAVEKNWIYAEHQSNLLLFYSINPFKVLILKDRDTFSFETVINKTLSKQLTDPGGFGTLVSFSTNPINFDDKFWLVIIHQINNKLTGRCYYHWAILIDKKSLLPVLMTKEPIFNGMGARGRRPGIRYISSVVKNGDDILFFAGEGDVYVTVTKKRVQDLQKMFVRIL